MTTTNIQKQLTTWYLRKRIWLSEILIIKNASFLFLFECNAAAADDAAGIFNLLRPFVPSTTQLHILDKNPWNILSGIDFLRETFDTSRFVSSMAQAESVRP